MHIAFKRSFTMTFAVTGLCAMILLAGAQTHAQTPAEQAKGKAMSERIKMFDANKDGKITREEFKGPEQIFKRVDRNGDGVISAEELDGLQVGRVNQKAGAAGRAAPEAAAANNAPERFKDGSTGRVTVFAGVGGATIPAYLRKPAGLGPFPLVIMLHGGGYGAAATYGLGRSMRPPTSDFIKAGWAVYAIDFRPGDGKKLPVIEYEDTVLAVKAARALDGIDSRRVGVIGGSHGGNVMSRVVSRTEVQGAVLCAPAALDLIQVKKAATAGEPVVGVLKKMIAEMETKHGAKAEEIEKDPAKFGYTSALTEVAGVRCPILIVNGRNDDNSPVSVINTYVGRLQAAGKQAETYMPDNGPHGFYFGRPDIPESKEASNRAMAFFKKCFAEVK